MAASPPLFCSVIMPSAKRISTDRFLLVRAQSCRDEGRANNFVDANLSTLRERIEEVRIKERLERSYKRSENGWNYAAGYQHKGSKKAAAGSSSHPFLIELFGLVGGTFGLTIVTGTLWLCLLSILLRFNQ